ncbi:flavodoxin domain-containing protein [Geodermatophilus aquaeductus]|uniref:Menaquinone-dependent protoporphyrinogen oxidase n=1 Tax=Geodermatophilus aquaeductus TaxID=1564161 RepID=A0A521FV09_9ACTN|nr:flavodoxin domain-containing protein [Geodermatophilus aquaeductus]SMP00013.1 menaquinone-dependent protoporphyrinogen oxidase [Geodermatophilus aquaeductus]
MSGQRVLVAVASRHGGTAGVAGSVADGLREGLGSGAVVEVRPVTEVDDVTGYDAVVVGSAVYHGHWLEAARDMVLRCAIDLWDRPVWIFSSGPVGARGRPPQELLEADEVLVQTRAREHRVFAGRLDRAGLGAAERAVAGLLFLPEGDRRDPADARAWGRAIAASLTAGQPGR